MKDLLTIKDKRLADVRSQDGAPPHAMGVKTYQVMHANRLHPEWADGYGWTYNHAPMLAWYHGRFYLEYLSSPVSEHEAPGHTLLTTSENGADWTFPQVIFPAFEAPTWQYRGATHAAADRPHPNGAAPAHGLLLRAQRRAAGAVLLQHCA